MNKSGRFEVVAITNIQKVLDGIRFNSSRINNETVVINNNIKVNDRGLLFKVGTRINKNLAKKLNLYYNEEFNENKKTIGILAKSAIVKPKLIGGVFTTALFIPFSIFNLHPDLVLMNSLDLGQKGFTFNLIRITEEIETYATKKENLDGSLNFKRDLKINHFYSDSKGIKNNNPVVITEMLEGTSGRCAYLKVDVKDTFINRLKKAFKFKIEDYKFISGNQSGIIDDKRHESYQLSQDLINKIYKGETIYYTAIGYKNREHTFGKPFKVALLKHLLGGTATSSMINIFGNTIRFNYNLNPGVYNLHVHRITKEVRNGEHIDLSWNQVQRRCFQMNIKTVPEIGVYYFKTQNKGLEVYDDLSLTDFNSALGINKILSGMSEARSKLHASTLLKGIVLRIDDGNNQPIQYKYLNTTYSLIDSIRKKRKFFKDFKEDAT